MAMLVRIVLLPAITRFATDTMTSSRYKCFKLIGLHPLCAVTFTAGYALREVAAFNYLYTHSHLILYIMTQVLIFICP